MIKQKKKITKAKKKYTPPMISQDSVTKLIKERGDERYMEGFKDGEAVNQNTRKHLPRRDYYWLGVLTVVVPVVIYWLSVVH
jgi:hypothetical protein